MEHSASKIESTLRSRATAALTEGTLMSVQPSQLLILLDTLESLRHEPSPDPSPAL